MRQAIRSGAALALAAALAACGQAPDEGAGEAASEGAPATVAPAADAPAPPPPAFAQCVSCHGVTPGRNGLGPTLYGVYGAPAASVPDFPYSPALKQSGLTWDEATLHRWLESPMKTVPGTRMVFAGTHDPARRQAIIDYMKTLQPAPAAAAQTPASSEL